MSRIRTIKPDFWVSEQIISCSHLARLLFIGMWNFVDDNGVHPKSYVSIKAEVFPVDNLSIDQIKACINELIQNELIREYFAEDKSYWLITGWKKHQRIDKPTKKHPFPEKIEEHSKSTPKVITEFSQSSIELLDEPSTTEGKGMEGKGMDINICEVQTSPVAASELNPITIKEIFEHWKTIMNHPRAKLDNKRKRAITNALRLGYIPSDLKKAIDGCANTPHNMGKNDSGQVYDDISLILRDANHIERFMNNSNISKIVHGSINTNDLMAGVL